MYMYKKGTSNERPTRSNLHRLHNLRDNRGDCCGIFGGFGVNIFVTHPSPTKSARYLCDVRLIKMTLETAQILSTALYTNSPDKFRLCEFTPIKVTKSGVTAGKKTSHAYYIGSDRLYKSTHSQHPATRWTSTNQANYRWTLAHFRALCEEYTRRYGKVHASSRLFPQFLDNISILPTGKRTPFANCAANASLGVSFKHLPVFEAYRTYLGVRFLNDVKPAVCKISC